MPQPSSGLFITVEGGEGAGKSSLIGRLKTELEMRGRKVISTFEPGATALGREIRALLLTVKKECPVSAKAELLLFLSDRAQHIEEQIRPALNQGAVVLCDRFNDSTVAYQGFARGIDLPTVTELCDAASGGLTPDCTLLLDLDPAVGLERSRKTNKKEAIPGSLDRMESESLAFHQKLRDGYLWIADQNQERVKVLDGSLAPELVFKNAVDALTPFL